MEKDSYLDKFGESGRRVLESALDETRRREQHYVSIEHILCALMNEETDLFDAAMRNLSIEPQDLRFAVEKRLENNHKHTGDTLRIAPEITDLFRHSMDKARSENRRVIEAGDICSVLAAKKHKFFDGILRN